MEVTNLSETIMSETMRQKEIDRKNIVIEYFELLKAGKFEEGLRFFAPDCKTHNPYISGNLNVLTDAMMAANKDMAAQHPEIEFAVKNVLVDGDLVAAHTEVLYSKSKPSEGGFRQVHLFRFEGDKIVEYWDITQEVLPNMPNSSGAF